MYNSHYPGGAPSGGPSYRGGQGPYYPPAPPRNPYKRPIRYNANIVGTGLILVQLVAFFTSELLLQLVFSLIDPLQLVEIYPQLTQVLSFVVYVLSFSVPIIVMMAWIGIPAQVAFPVKRLRLDLALPAVFFCLGVAAVGARLSDMLSLALQSTFGIRPIMSYRSPPGGIIGALFYIFSLAVIPAILEELMFRGVIMQSLRRFGDSFALVVSSILFALCHGNLVQGPSALLMGLTMGYFVLRSGSITLGILIHFVNNLIICLMELLPPLSYTMDVLLGAVVIFVYYILSAAALVFLLLRHNKMFRLAPSHYPLPESEKHLLFYTSVLPVLYLLYMIFITARNFEFIY